MTVVRVVIELDTDTRRATVAVDGRPSQTWKDCDMQWSKSMVSVEADGWIRQEPTHERSFTLYGTRTV